MVEFNNTVLDESLDESIDASAISNVSPQTKLFPIFTKQTPSPSHIAW